VLTRSDAPGEERLHVASRSRPCRVMHDAWTVGLGGVAWGGCVIIVEGILLVSHLGSYPCLCHSS
jgi:hypothetical protein